MNAITLNLLIQSYYLPNYDIDNSVATKEGIEFLVENGLITNGLKEITAKGSFHIKKLLETPLPIQQWV